MRIVIQRVSRAAVSVDGIRISSIGAGMLILLGVEHGDTEEDVAWLVKKASRLRIFDDSEGIMNLDILQTGGEALVVSQFTLYASTVKGNRPSYIRAAGENLARPLYELFIAELGKALGHDASSGRFGADMQVELVNSGPVTIILDSDEIRPINN